MYLEVIVFDANETHKKLGQPRKEDNNSSKEQEQDKIPSLSFAQMEGKCYCCGKAGHKLPVCCHKGKPKDEWAINKAEINQEQQHAQQNKRIEEIEVITKKTEPESSASSRTDDMSVNTVGWAGTHYQHVQSLNMRDEILLDTASSTSLFGNKEYVAGIKEAKGNLELHTNGGPIFSNETASVNKFGDVWYNKDSVANSFSFAEMLKRYCITLPVCVQFQNRGCVPRPHTRARGKVQIFSKWALFIEPKEGAQPSNTRR
jgi:hypothetical protein